MNHNRNLRRIAFVLLLGIDCSSKSAAPGGAGSGGTGVGGLGGGSAVSSGGTSAVPGSGGRPGTPGSGGGGVTPGSGGQVPPPGGSASVTERNNNPARDGHFIQPTLTRAKASTFARETAFAANFMGDMWAAPLFLENGPGGKGVFFAVTTANVVYALDETTGAVVWMRSIGTPSTSATNAGGQCNNGNLINPLGILSTPVLDVGKRTLYVAGVIGDATGIGSHIATAINVDDGTVRPGWPVDVSTTLAFDPKIHNQRSALSLVGGILYVAYAGFVGDCKQYRGRVAAINTADPTMIAGWASGGIAEGIWAAGGMASDGNGVIAVTGNSTTGTATHLDSEQVMRITGMATVDRTSQNVFFPTRWRTMDSTDADFGGSNPILLKVPGATPASYVLAVAKDGHMYLLDSTRLGGADGSTPVVDFTVAAGAMAVKTAPTAYAVGGTTRVALTTDSGAQCPTPGAGRVVMSVAIPAGAPPVPTRVWCAPLAGSGSPAAPISTSTDGQREAIVWVMNNGALFGFDGDTGAVVFDGTASGTCAGVRRWTSPIAVKGRIVAGGDGHLCSWAAP